MKSHILPSLAVGASVAVAARASEIIATAITPQNHDLHDSIGAGVTFVATAVITFLWRANVHRKLMLIRERERVRAHVHHHIRNALNTIVLSCADDKLVLEQAARIVRELESVLPSRESSF